MHRGGSDRTEETIQQRFAESVKEIPGYLDTIEKQDAEAKYFTTGKNWELKRRQMQQRAETIEKERKRLQDAQRF
jgi:hypothetical protein